MRLQIYITLLALALTPVFAQEPADQPAPVSVPPPPPMAEDGARSDLPPPSVTIRREEGKLVEEYRAGGVVYMVRVTPEHGVSYYLMDMDGDGILEKTDLELGPNMQIPMWTLYEWK